MEASPAPRAEPSIDRTEGWFSKDRVFEVDITMDPSDWGELSAQTRSFLETLGGVDCLAEPFGSPFTYFPATVAIEGERLENVGVRKKGFIGSLSAEKPSLKLKFDEFERGREFSGFERMTLNNARQDPALIRQCLAYGIYAAAGVIAPRCAFAHVTVNGADLGIYVHVDSIDKRFLRRHFEDAEGDLFEGTLSDFRPGWMETFEQKTNEDVPADRGRLALVAAALEGENGGLLDRLAPLVDLDAFLAYWAVESLVGHWDGYAGNTNNFYVYDDPTGGRFRFIAWGVDAAFVEGNPFLGGEQPASVMAQGLLARRLYTHPEGRARYLEVLGSLLEGPWDEAAILAEIDASQALLLPRITRGRQDLVEAIEEVKTFVRRRRDTVERELAIGGAEWTVPLRESICLPPLGSVRAAFETEWGTHPSSNPFGTGTGTIAVTLEGRDLFGGGGSAIAGFGENPDDRGQAVIIALAEVPPLGIGIVYVVMPPDRMQPGADVRIDGTEVRGALLRIPAPGREIELVGFFLDGMIALEEASVTEGARIAGRVESAVYRF